MAAAPKLMLIDGNSLAHRAFYALPPLATKEGIPTNAVFGFTSMLLKIMDSEKPDYMAVAFDKGRVTFRHDVYSDYKATRKATPEELRPQFPLIKKLLQAMNLLVLEVEGLEADDLIGALSLLAEKEQVTCLIVTGDRDALQLVSPTTQVLLTRKGITDLEIYDEAAIFEKYGLQPAQITDLKGLMGDQSDNIPGVPGIGEKTALKLLHQFGNVEELLERDAEIKPERIRQLVITNADLARLSKQLATINRDCNLELDLGQLQVKPPDYPQLLEIARELEFKNLINRITGAMQQQETQPAAADGAQVFEVAGADYRVTFSPAELAEWLSDRNTGCLALGLLGGGNDQLQGVALSPDRGQAVFLDLSSPQVGELLAVAGEWLGRPEIDNIIYDAKDAFNSLKIHGLSLAGELDDPFLAAYLIDPGRAGLAFEELVLNHLNLILPQLAGADLALARADLTGRLMEILDTKLQIAGIDRLYRELEIPLVKVLAAMERVGIKVDLAELAAMGDRLNESITKLTAEIHDLAGEEFNINSTRQLGQILFEKLQLPVQKKTKTGYATGAEILETLTGYHPIAEKLLEYRQLVKLKTTYIDGLQVLVDRETSRLHTTFNQAVTATGRLSSTEPNLQNIPIRLQLGREIRKAFVASAPEHKLLAADYSQIELRILAHLAGDQNLIRAFNDEEDIHTRTAAEVFGLPAGEVTSEMRRRAKAVNFGIVYGISDFGLARDIGVTRAEAKKYIENYFSRYPGVQRYLRQIIVVARDQGYVTTILNRRRYLPDLFSPNKMVRNFGERTAMNTPIQGSAADIIKLAMVKIHHELQGGEWEAKMILQVHDELVFDVPDREVSSLARLVKDQMEQVLELQVPLIVDLKVGPDWYNMAKIEVD